MTRGTRTGGVLARAGPRQPTFGRPGRYAGQFLVLHNIGIDSQGNLCTAEVATGKRVQKFVPAR